MIGAVVWSLQNLDSLRAVPWGERDSLPALSPAEPLEGRIARERLPELPFAMVDRGELRVLATDEDDFDEPIAFLESGDFFGVTLGDDARDPAVGAALFATPGTRIRAVDPARLGELLPLLSGPTVKHLHRFRLADLTVPLDELVGRPLAARVAAVLLRLDAAGIALPAGRFSRLTGALSHIVDWELEWMAEKGLARRRPIPRARDRERLAEIAAERIAPYEPPPAPASA